MVIKKAVCMHEEDAGILWKHMEYRDGTAEVRRSRRLVISFIATVVNYECTLHLAGSQPACCCPVRLSASCVSCSDASVGPAARWYLSHADDMLRLVLEPAGALADNLGPASRCIVLSRPRCLDCKVHVCLQSAANLKARLACIPALPGPGLMCLLGADAFYWNFYQDGTIDYQIKLTGELSTNALSPHEVEMGKVRPVRLPTAARLSCLQCLSLLAMHAFCLH